MIPAMNATRFLRPALGAAAIVAGLLALPAPAQADYRHRHRSHVGVFVGVSPGYWAPRPYYYAPPPVYYAPPPAYYPAPVYYPPPVYAGPSAQACYAGPYMCQLDQPVAAGSSCSCPVNGNTRAYGRAGG